MSRVLKISGFIVVSVLALAGIVILLLYQAARAVPEFYLQASAVEPAEMIDERDAFVARASALASDLHTEGHWQSLFSADEINAWLALELATNYPKLLPPEMREPRISIEADGASLGCIYKTGELDAVVSVKFEAYLHSPHVVAIRICQARAGALPVPLGSILDGISSVAQQLNLRLEWRKAQGDPVALVTLPPLGTSPHETLRLESVELREGELFVAGTVGHPGRDSQPIVSEPLIVPTAKIEFKHDQPRIGSTKKETLQK